MFAFRGSHNTLRFHENEGGLGKFMQTRFQDLSGKFSDSKAIDFFSALEVYLGKAPRRVLVNIPVPAQRRTF